MTRLAALFFCTTALAAPALAQPQDEEQQEPQQQTESADQPTADTTPVPVARQHHDESNAIVVTGVRELDILAGTSVISGEKLQREVKPQIGDTLTSLPGVSATSFSPGASRPVLRGFQGERIRVLIDGIGSIDVSNTSADHAVTIDPLTVDRIEVLRGPAVLLYGSQAIGGAVNAIDRRIPRHVPEEGYHVDALGLYGSAAEERSIGGSVEFAIGGGLVGHVDGSFRKTDDLRVGGYLLSPELREEQFEIAEEEFEEGHIEEAEEALALANSRGKIPNSATDQRTAGAGLALIRDNFNVGVSYTRFETDYGVPTRPGAEHHHEEEEELLTPAQEDHEHGDEAVKIGMHQDRFDLRGGYSFDTGFLDSIQLRVGGANYEHTEFEGEEVGTVFRSEGVEGRLEFVQRESNGWRGASGLQYFTRDFEAIGAEAFVPPNKTHQFGLFTLQEFDLGRFGLEAAARFEHTKVDAHTLDMERKFDAFSAALGGSYEIAPRVNAGINISRSERAPSAEELFADGPHIATQAFEIGDPNLKKESNWGAEAYFRVERANVTLSATAFANWFNDFIFLANTGEEEDELPVFVHRQQDATFYGFEAEASARLFEAGRFTFVADAVADYVRATIKDGGPVPRIPPLRVLAGIEAQSDKLDGRLEVERVTEQDRVAEFENPTGGFTMVNASLAWKPWGAAREITLMLSANNIFDVDARRHASFTKDFVPLAGRDIRVSARLAF